MKVAEDAGDTGAGVTWVVEDEAPDDTMRWQIAGEPYPRIVVDPHRVVGGVLVGDGQTAPGVLGGFPTIDGLVLPDIDGYSVTHPGGDQSHVVSLAGGKLRIGAGAANTDPNLRRVYGLTPPVLNSELRWTIDSLDADWTSTALYQWGAAFRIRPDRYLLARKAVVSATASTVVCAAASFVASEFVGAPANMMEVLVAVTGAANGGNVAAIGQVRRVSANTATTLTIEDDWTVQPDNTNTIQVYAYMVRAVAIMPVIVFGAHWGFQVVNWNGNAFVGNTGNPLDLSAYLRTDDPGPHVRAFPWRCKARLVGRTLDFAVAAGSDDLEYGIAGRSGTFTLDDVPGAHGPGATGLYLGHMDASTYVNFDDVLPIPL